MKKKIDDLKKMIETATNHDELEAIQGQLELLIMNAHRKELELNGN